MKRATMLYLTLERRNAESGSKANITLTLPAKVGDLCDTATGSRAVGCGYEGTRLEAV